MKITFVIQDLFQQGAQYVTALMIRGFVAKGYEVDLIVSHIHAKYLAEGTLKPFEIPCETTIITLPDDKARNNISALRHYLRKSDTKAVIAMSPNYMWAVALASVGLIKKPILSFVEHSGFMNVKEENNIKGPTFFSAAWIKAKFLASCFPVIMAVSKGTARAVEQMYGFMEGRVKTVYNPVVDDVFYKKLRGETKHPWLVNKTIPTFMAAGAHCELKGHLMLFEAIRLANKIMKVRLVLFGKGYLTETYRKWINEHDMADYIDIAQHTDNLPAEIKAADAFIVSSELESFSIVLVEAMAADTPIISTNCKYGPPELLEYGKYGKLVPVGDAQAMADAIVAHIKKPTPIAPVEAWNKFSLDNVVGAYERALGLF